MAKVRDQLPTYHYELFNASAIELCLVQVKFPPVMRFNDAAFRVGIEEALAEEYPIFEKDQAFNLTLTPQGVAQQSAGDLLRFMSLDRRWSVLLGAEVVSIETREYSDVQELGTRFESVLRLISDHLKVRHQLRFGLRYVNEFRHHRGDRFETWRRLLNPALLGLSGTDVIGGTIEQTINEVRFQRPDGTFLLRHGFLNGTTVATPNRPPKTGHFYLLDLDYYVEVPLPFDTKPLARIQPFNDFLYRVFRWAIGDGDLYRQLKGD